jgi:hypothetical protein
MIVRCEAATGINLASDSERNKPKDVNSEAYDPAAGGYLSHPKNTESSIITVNTDGTASQTTFFQDGTSLVSELHILR